MVYEVKHCGFSVAWRERDEDGDWDMWNLVDQNACAGVSWAS
jgi:hypothetical protein